MLLAAAGLATCLQGFGQSASEVWLSMPADVVPSLDAGQRQALVDYYGMATSSEGDSVQVKAEVTNRLGGTTRLQTLTDGYMRVELSPSAVLEMKLLPDSVVCLAHTFLGPRPETRLAFYTTSWKPLSDSLFPLLELVRPDSLPEADFQELKARIPLVVWQVELSATDNTATATPSFPLATIEEKDKLQPLIMQTKLNWEEGKFNICLKATEK